MANTKITSNVIADNAVGISALNVSDGSNGQVLSTNGSGTLSFSTVSGTTINNNADNRIITGSGTANTLEGESGLTYDGSTLAVTGAITSDSTVTTLSNFNSTSGNDLRLNAGSANRDIFMQVNGTTHMTVQGSTGNVGIKTTSPDALLEVSNITANDIPFFISGGTASLGSLPETTGMAFGYGSAAGYKKGAILWEFIATNATGKLHFCNDGAADAGNAQLSDSKMTIDSTGNVGIGITSPTVPLDIQSNASASAIRIRGRSDDIAEVDFYNNANNSVMARFQVDTGYIATHCGGSERMRIDSGGLITAGTSASALGKNIRNWTSNGYIEIGGDLPGYNVSVYPTVKTSHEYLFFSVNGSYSSHIQADGTYTAISDETVKTNISTLSSGQLNKITNLRGVNYNWLDENKGTETQMGLIAQELELEYPELVSEGAGVLKGVNYAGLVSPLIEAVKELKTELDAAKARITTLENA